MLYGKFPIMENFFLYIILKSNFKISPEIIFNEGNFKLRYATRSRSISETTKFVTFFGNKFLVKTPFPGPISITLSL